MGARRGQNVNIVLPLLQAHLLRRVIQRLLESGDGSNEELGAELLHGIIEERPRSKLAKSAKNKLKLTGHLDED